MAKKNKKQELVDSVESFNDVTAWITPNGELVICLSHRNTSDGDMLVRVRADDDVIIVADEPSNEPEHGAWELPGSKLERLNTGGNWNLVKPTGESD